MPRSAVNQIRRALGCRLRAMLYPATVVDCSMERREGKAYDFNEPTLENAFKLGGFTSGAVYVLPVFLFAGNHAGPGGDIENIINRAIGESHKSNTSGITINPPLTVQVGRLLTDDSNFPEFLELIRLRLKQAYL